MMSNCKANHVYAVIRYDWDNDDGFICGLYYKKSNAARFIEIHDDEDCTVDYNIKEIKINDAEKV